MNAEAHRIVGNTVQMRRIVPGGGKVRYVAQELNSKIRSASFYRTSVMRFFKK